ncbi:DUF4960 domain-containing protein [Candidatus Chrysopegis kryptomonas]|uniref:Uncharacterized protein n=1 Tax=Candidatus Chryseopegocella kryptomonas TaxID=1633643 RepID=A0A0P1MKF2_9BACT|nr:DUF4960 domain-containing protein [Candidatus Chrysopegis kryptomonas]CUS96054.1 hypothetical protein JGI23_00049 [Candidatus Chrysopegis kryptomonas]
MKIAFLIDSEPSQEQLSAFKWLRARTGCAFQVEIEKINNANLNEFNIIWWHYDKSLNLPEFASSDEFKTTLLNFLNRGGNLLLTLTAVKLLNVLNIEPIEPDFEKREILTSSRSYGFASFLGHPVFRKLHNATYTFTASEKTEKIMLAYVDRTPENLKIVGIEKVDDKINPTKKILFEFESKFKIIAIGGYVYFSDKGNPNWNNLDRLLLNSILYLNNPRKFPEPKTYWDFRENITRASFQLENKALRTAQKKIGRKSTDIQSEIKGNYLIQGEQIFAEITEQKIKSISIPPLQIIDEISLSLKSNEEFKQIEKPQLILKPEAVVRNFEIGEAKFCETIFTHPKKPILISNFLITSDKEIEICLNLKISPKFLSEPKFQIKNFSFGFDEKLKCFYVFNPQIFAIFAGSARKPESYEIKVGDFVDVKIFYKVSAGSEKAFNFAITGVFQNPRAPKDILSESKELYKLSLTSPHKIFKENFKSVRNALRKYLTIETQDENINQKFKFAVSLLPKFMKDVKTLGRFLVNDLREEFINTEKILNSLNTLLKIGDYEDTRDTLEFLGRYISVDSKLPQKFLLSGFFEYDNNLKFNFIKICGDYLRSSKDKLFAKFTWQRIKNLISGEIENLQNYPDAFNSILLFANTLEDSEYMEKLNELKSKMRFENGVKKLSSKINQFDLNSAIGVSSFVEKILDDFEFDVNAFEKKLTFKPRIKDAIGSVKMKNLRLQNMRINITIEKSSDCLVINFEKNNLPEINVNLEIFESPRNVKNVLIDDKVCKSFECDETSLKIGFSFRFKRQVKILFD